MLTPNYIPFSIESYLCKMGKLREEVTVENAKLAIYSFLRDAQGFDQNCLIRFVQVSRERGLAASSISKYVDQVIPFLRWCKEQGHIGEVPPRPFPRVNCHKDRQTFTRLEYDSLLATSHSSNRITQLDRFWPYGVQMGWHTPFRMKDIALLQWKAIDRAERLIRTIPSKTRFIGRHVTVPFGDNLAALFERQAADPYNKEYVCTAMALRYQGERHMLSSRFLDLARRAGVRGKSFHCFRHTWITRMLEAGIAPATVCAMSGQTLQQVQTYMHISLAAKRAAVEAAA